MTLMEVFIIIAIVAVLALLMLSSNVINHRQGGFVHRCRNNLRIIGSASQVFAVEHHMAFPGQVAIFEGGAKGSIDAGSPLPVLLALSNYLGGSGLCLFCPADSIRRPSADMNQGFSDKNISYFFSFDAFPSVTNSILAGDRNLEVGGHELSSGLFGLNTNTSVRWANDLHSVGAGEPCGNILFADGHVETIRKSLDPAIRHQGMATNQIAIP